MEENRRNKEASKWSNWIKKEKWRKNGYEIRIRKDELVLKAGKLEENYADEIIKRNGKVKDLGSNLFEQERRGQTSQICTSIKCLKKELIRVQDKLRKFKEKSVS